MMIIKIGASSELHRRYDGEARKLDLAYYI